ncbi:hypothetical protein LIER_39288 [Lithospermum erythrorhizon]|uniref:Uncharacterized protein n=1 Tax=Lithospermum erythrorhizon TaxID=34254 RepID=A0AAV3QEY5_LITER
MLLERPSLFTRVAITSIPAVLIPSKLKRLAKKIPAITSRPSKRLKKSAHTKRNAQVLARHSEEEEAQPLDGKVRRSEERVSLFTELDTPFPPNEQPPLNAEVPKETPKEVIRQRKGKATAFGQSFPAYDERHLELPYTIPPNLEVSGKTPWNTRKFHYHAVKPLKSKKVATRYRNLSNPYASFAQMVKHITEVDSGQTKRKEESLVEELLKEKVAAAESEELRKGLVIEKTKMQARYEELEWANAGDIMKASESLEHAKKDKEMLWPKLSPNYEAKVGRECGTYLTHLVVHCKERLPELVTLFALEKNSHLAWFDVLSIDPSPTPANEDDFEDGEEDAKLHGKSHSPPT